MSEPPQDRSLDGLHSMFRAPFEAWMERAQAEAQHVHLFVTETRRTQERQDWLYMQGREEPYLDQPKVTWTRESRHQWGLAADVAMQRRDGSLIWESDSWQWLYRVSEIEQYGLIYLAPLEWVHVEFRYADLALGEQEVLGLVKS